MDEPLEVTIGKLLRQRGLRLAAAESCTGGLFGHLITDVSGSSAYYVGGITAYAYEAKVRLLGVRWDSLDKYGAVSRETALEMARGVRKVLAADIGISITGIAGPGGGMPDKPIGLTWIGLSADDLEEAWQFVWSGDRVKNKEESARAALQLLVDYLNDPKRKKSAQMDQIEMTAHYDAQGKATPLTFTWEGQNYAVESTGRRWEDEKGLHVLVMVPGGRVFEVLFAPVECRWYLSPVGYGKTLA